MDSESVRENIESGAFKLINKRKGTNEIWTIFAEIENNNEGNKVGGWVCCRNCKKVYKYNGKQSSNLNRHKCYMEKSDNEPLKKLTCEQKSETINVLADWVIEDCRPFRSVSGDGFRKMAEYFIKLGSKFGQNIDYLLPDATTISRRINKLAEEEKLKLKTVVPKVIEQNKASITVDMWTDEYVRRNFLCATFHFEENLTLKELVLGMKSMDFNSSTGVNIHRKQVTLLEEFGVSDLANIKFITDRGSNIKNALQSQIRLNCSNHLLSDIVEGAFDENSDIIQIVVTCKNLVKFFKKSNLQQLLSTSLKNYCPTRWNSYLEMFKSICDNWIDINNILTEKNQTHKVNQINYGTIQALFKFCQDIDVISRKLQGTKYPTLCYVLHA